MIIIKVERGYATYLSRLGKSWAMNPENAFDFRQDHAELFVDALNTAASMNNEHINYYAAYRARA